MSDHRRFAPRAVPTAGFFDRRELEELFQQMRFDTASALALFVLNRDWTCTDCVEEARDVANALTNLMRNVNDHSPKR
jgi:hypothetical protein